jgi:hypothetical protein
VLKRVVVIFRFLASGNSKISLSFSYRIALSAVRSIITSTCEAIWNKLPPIELPQPTEEEWIEIAAEFCSLWQFPNCTGVIDGKHIETQDRITVDLFSLTTERYFL